MVGTSLQVLTISGATSPVKPTFTPTIPGTYHFQCYADDGNDISPPVEIIIVASEGSAGGQLNELSLEQGDGNFRDRCFIATAAYGSLAEKQVVLLRDFRDQYLLNNSAGRAFVRTYYRLSPPVADYISTRPALRFFTRILLYPLIFISWFLLEANPLVQLIILTAMVVATRKMWTLIRKRKRNKYRARVISN